MTDPLASHLDALLVGGGVRTLFQPIVDLATREALAFEALSRGPEGSALERPDRLFGAARAEGRVHELDVLCQTTAISSAIAGGLAHPQWLFLNAEPETLGRTDARLIEACANATRASLPLVVEVTERSVTASPAELLRSLDQVRATGARIAMDDIGADARALALLPLIRPDVIKLDLRLVQQQPSRAIARIVNAVNAEAERTGAAILAEGIETEEHFEVALALGATLGQGWLFGHPGPLPDRLARPDQPVGPAFRPVIGLATPDRTPFERCAADRTPRIARKRLLIEMSKHLETEALGVGELAVLLSTFQEARNFTPHTARRYGALAAKVAFVAALGDGLSPEPAAGVRGAFLHPDDPVRGEWDVVALGPHFAAALVARDLGDTGPDHERRFEFVLTYDRDRVLASARALFERVWAEQDRHVEMHDDPSAPAVVGTDPGRPSAPLTGLSELHLRALDAAASGVTIAAVNGRSHPLVYVNEGFERLTGYHAEDILGRDCRFLQGPRTDPATVRRLSEAVHSRRGGHERVLNYRADGTEWWNDIVISPVRDVHGEVTHLIGVQADVTAEMAAQSQLHHLAFHDELTGLPNRRALFDALLTELHHSERTGRSLAVAFIDLDGFKAVNDLAGHDQGDEVLVEIAARLRAAVREGDVVARQHGDEFVLLLTDLSGNAAQTVGRITDALLTRLAEPVAASRGPVQVSASIGVALAPADGTDPDAVLRAADRAMAEAKLAGKATVRFASAERFGAVADAVDAADLEVGPGA